MLVMKMNSIDVEKPAIETLCRACMASSKNMQSVFTIVETTAIVDMLMEVSSLQIKKDDGLPSVICTTCIQRMRDAFEFKRQCVKTEENLKGLIYKSESIKEEYLEDDCDDMDTCNSDTNYDNSKEKNTSINKDVYQQLEPEINIEETINIVNAQNQTEKSDESIKISNNIDIKKPEIINGENIKLSQKLVQKHPSKFTSKKKISKKSYYTSFTINEHGIKVYNCTICQKQYKHTTSLKVHMRTHTGHRPFLCTLCGKGFKQFTGLSYHMRSHTGERPFECDMCHKKYRQSASLKAHMRVHTGQRPFLCSVCGKGFRQAPDLSYHMRTHTKEKPYMCTVCGKRMSMSCHLVQHMRTHTGEKPFSCSECGKSFASTTRLKRHEIIHTGLKPYVCDVCDKAFNRSSTLRVHSMIHTDERPHVCSTCGRGFIQAHCLRSHMNTHIKSEQQNSKTESLV